MNSTLEKKEFGYDVELYEIVIKPRDKKLTPYATRNFKRNVVTSRANTIFLCDETFRNGKT